MHTNQILILLTASLLLTAWAAEAQTPMSWRQLQEPLKERRVAATAAGEIRREMLKEVDWENGWKVSFWSSSFAAPGLDPPGYPQTAYREEITLSAPDGSKQLVYAGNDELSRNFASRTEGFLRLSAAQATSAGLELLLRDERLNVALMRLKRLNGLWEYDSDFSIADTATGPRGSSEEKFVGPGKIECSLGDTKTVYDMSVDGVVRENGAPYRPPYAQYDETHGLEEGYRKSYRVRRETQREALRQRGILPAAPSNNLSRVKTTPTGSALSLDLDGPDQKQNTPPQPKASPAETTPSHKTEVGGTLARSPWLWLLVTVVGAAIALQVRARTRRL